VLQLERITFIYWTIECTPRAWFEWVFQLEITWKNYLHLLVNWMHSKSLIWMGVPSWKNYLHLLANWMHSKSLICEGVPTWKKYFHLLANWMHMRSLFIKLLQLESIVKKYIHLWANWVHSSMGELSAFKVLHLLRCSNLK
jgi:hypothetical protein